MRGGGHRSVGRRYACALRNDFPDTFLRDPHWHPQGLERKHHQSMHSDDELTNDESSEIGSDELLSDENLRLPSGANILVRLHAVRAWIARRHNEAAIEVGEAALALQQTMLEEPSETGTWAHPQRRREQRLQDERQQQVQQFLTAAQERLNAYEEAQALLEECIAHNSGERVLVEYYLALEELVQSKQPQSPRQPEPSPWLSALADVQHRIEHVGAPNEEEE